jgi:glycosyltransferase involved in cell wall biosynthesis
MADGALIVIGMHRSGTSMVGGMLSAAGIRMGNRLIRADRANPRGYFEDADIVDFHGRLFRDALPGAQGPHVDWGVVEGRELDQATLERHLAEARQLAADRAGDGGRWGFKDPRTSMVLPLWDRAIDDARYLLVYRFPWEVADSMQRGGAEVFRLNPGYAYRAWLEYNRALLDFFEANRERCVLVSTNALTSSAESPVTLSRTIASRLGIELAPDALASGVDSKLFTAGDADDHRADLVAAAYPECVDLLTRLDATADISGAGLWRSERPPTTRFAAAPEGEVELSIIVPTWNDGVLLLEALASAERWAPAGAELLIVDDGSTDPETRAILERLRAQGYRVHSKPNGGLSSARNAGIERARGRFILPLDADNRLVGGFWEQALELLRTSSDVDVVYGDRKLFGALDEVLPAPEFDFERLLGGNQIDACALYRRELWSRVGGYDTVMTGLEDWEYWIAIAKAGARFVRLPRVAFEYRLRGESLLAVSLRPAVRRQLFARILDRHPELYHARVPAPVRLLSTLLGPLLGAGLRARLARVESALFWQPLWFLIGSGGLFSSDRRMLRARKG